MNIEDVKYFAYTIAEIVSDMVGMDYDYAKKRTDGCSDFDKIVAAARRYETTLRN